MVGSSKSNRMRWTKNCRAAQALKKMFLGQEIDPDHYSGEAIYEIGVEDNGLMTGLSDEDMDSSLDTLREMARRLGATIQVLRERVVTTEHGTRTVSEVLVRKVGT